MDLDYGELMLSCPIPQEGLLFESNARTAVAERSASAREDLWALTISVVLAVSQIYLLGHSWGSATASLMPG
jgi:hypothetical protein